MSDMTQKWCWWRDDLEQFHMADAENEAHGEAHSSIDSDGVTGDEYQYTVARVQHPMDSVGMDWIATHVAESIEENICCWCDDDIGSEEPSIELSAEDRQALGKMVADFVREKASVGWWTSDKKTQTEHTYAAGSDAVEGGAA